MYHITNVNLTTALNSVPGLSECEFTLVHARPYRPLAPVTVARFSFPFTSVHFNAVEGGVFGEGLPNLVPPVAAVRPCEGSQKSKVKQC